MTALQQLCDCGPVWLPYRKFKREGGTRKIALKLDGRWASVSREEEWQGYRRAEAYVENLGADGLCWNVGLTPFIVFDIDRADNEKVQNFVGWLDSYTEVSPSGQGLHVIVSGELPPDHYRKIADFFGPGFPLEVYQTDRYVTFTGTGKGEIRNRQAELDLLYQKRLRKPVEAQGARSGGREGEVSDEAVLGAIQGREEWVALWEGADPDSSRNDWNLIKLLVWFTQDAEQIDRLFRQSGCYRDKWEQSRGRGTYGEITIRKALEARR